MTYSQIQQIDYYFADIQRIQHAKLTEEELYREVETLDSQIRSVVEEYNPKGISLSSARIPLYESVFYDKEAIYNYLKVMFDTLRSVWNAIPNRDKILEVGADVDYGRSLNVSIKPVKIEYIRKITEKYSCEINANKDITEIVSKSPHLEVCEEMQVNRAYYSTLSELEKYLMLLSNDKDVKEGTNMPQININNFNGGSAIANAAAEANNKVNISVQIDQAIEQVKDACLKPEEEAAILAKLEEIKEIAQEKNKKNRWEKLKDVFKWLAEQSFQAAAWIVPLAFQLIKNT